MMTDWYDKMVKALQLNGKGERTQKAYTRALRMLIDFYSKTPEQPQFFPGGKRSKAPKIPHNPTATPRVIAHPTARSSSEPRNQKALPYMQSLSRSGLLEPRIETTFQDRLNPYLLGTSPGFPVQQFAGGRQLLKPQLLEHPKILGRIVVRLVRGLQLVQHFELERIRAESVPIRLKFPTRV
jgi:hypothetical protein